jgi:3-hydroxy-D-aspartate aldolase
MTPNMTARPPADIGVSLDDIDTPALLIDLDAFERNLRRMGDAARRSGLALRPHAKTHKSPMIAHKQIALGAVGVCCQKVSEAEVMAHAGIKDILVSNEIVGRTKIGRLVALAREVRLSVCVDDADNVRALSRAAVDYGANLDVLVEIDVGANRCGVAPGTAALELAGIVARAPGLVFAGLQAYHGPAQHTRDYGERGAQIAVAIRQTEQTRELLSSHGLDCRVISGAGTGTYLLEASAKVCTELQAGSYIFMDGDYAKNRAADGGPFGEFEHSLFVHTAIMSRPTAGRAVVDAGLKALGVDAGMPDVSGLDGARYIRASDEHGIVSLEGPAQSVSIGERLNLIAANCDPTVNLHDWYVGVRDERVEALWPISARGPGF